MPSGRGKRVQSFTGNRLAPAEHQVRNTQGEGNRKKEEGGEREKTHDKLPSVRGGWWKIEHGKGTELFKQKKPRPQTLGKFFYWNNVRAGRGKNRVEVANNGLNATRSRDVSCFREEKYTLVIPGNPLGRVQASLQAHKVFQ